MGGWQTKGHIVTNSFPSRNAVISFIIYVVEEGVKNQTTCHYNQFLNLKDAKPLPKWRKVYFLKLLYFNVKMSRLWQDFYVYPPRALQPCFT